MKTFAVDASVAAKWFFPEEHSTASLRLLLDRPRLIAPDLLGAEFGNLVWQRSRRREITRDQAKEIMADFLRLPLEIIASAPLLPAAVEIAVSMGITVYDSLYLSLAVEEQCPLVTADRRLIRDLGNTVFARCVWHVGEKLAVTSRDATSRTRKK